MLQELIGSPRFNKTVARFDAWWVGEIIDRPPVLVSVTPSRSYGGPVSTHTDHQARWLDVEFVVEEALAKMAQTDYVGDRFPLFWSNIGPEITATLYGCPLTFTESTSWSTPVVHSADEWQRILTLPPDFTNVYWQTMVHMTDYAIEHCAGRYIVGITDIHGNYDILAALRDPMQLCLDLMDCPELVAQAGMHVADGYVAAFDRLYAQVATAGFGATSWLPIYYRGPAYVPSSDFWCMVSPQLARDLILPAILREMEPLERSIFHLDGPQALRHLDLLLDLPQLHAVQWVYGAGRGPAARWIDVYRRIRQAGKSLQLIAQNAQDALTVLDAIGPAGVLISVEEPFASVAEAENFIQQITKRV